MLQCTRCHVDSHDRTAGCEHMVNADVTDSSSILQRTSWGCGRTGGVAPEAVTCCEPCSYYFALTSEGRDCAPASSTGEPAILQLQSTWCRHQSDSPSMYTVQPARAHG